jgi:hypothetical protein
MKLSDRLKGPSQPGRRHRADRSCRSSARRRIDESASTSRPHGRRPPARRLPRERDHPAARRRRPVRSRSASSPSTRSGRRPDRVRHADRRSWPSSCDAVRPGAQHPRQRRHRHRQDDAAQRAVELHPAGERIVTIEDAVELQLHSPTSSAREPPANIEGRARSPSATWSATRCACARPHHRRRGAAAPRRSTCCRR